MCSNKSTQTETNEGTRTISVQTGEQGAWTKEIRVGYVILPTGKFVRGQGEVARARGSQTQTTWGTDHGCQATEEDLTDQMAKEAYKNNGIIVSYYWENDLMLAHLTDDNIKDWTPGDSLKAQFNKRHCRQDPIQRNED